MATAEAILEMMKISSEQAKVLMQSIPTALSSPELSLSNAEQLLSFCVRYLAGVDRLYDAIEQAATDETIDDELEASASHLADACHTAGLTLQNDVFDMIRNLGGNANGLLSEFHSKYYAD